MRDACASNLLVDPHGADPQRVGAGHFPALEQHYLGGAAAHLEDERVRSREQLALVLEGMLYAEIHEVVLLDVLDDRHLEPGLQRDPVHESVAVLRLAQRARRDHAGVFGNEAVTADELAEGGEDGHALADCLAAHHAGGEHVAADSVCLPARSRILKPPWPSTSATTRRIPVEPISMTATTRGLVATRAAESIAVSLNALPPRPRWPCKRRRWPRRGRRAPKGGSRWCPTGRA